MITSIMKTKKTTLFIIWSFFVVCLSPSLHAKNSLPGIKNETPWTVTLSYFWSGCGAFDAHKKGGGERNHARVQLSPGGTYTLSRGCIARGEKCKPTITVYGSGRDPILGVEVTLDGKGHLSSVRGISHSSKGELQTLCTGSSCTLLALKYDPKITFPSGFYWEAID